MDTLFAVEAATLLRKWLDDPGAVVTDDELSALQTAKGRYGERLMAESADYREAVRALSRRTHPGADVRLVEIRREPTDVEVSEFFGHLAPESVEAMLRDPGSGQE